MTATTSSDHATVLSGLVTANYAAALVASVYGLFALFPLGFGSFILFAYFFLETGFPRPAGAAGMNDALKDIALACASLVVGVAWAGVYLTLSRLLVKTAKSLRARRDAAFCARVSAAAAVLCCPLGTIVGALTIHTLRDPAVTQLFQQGARQPAGAAG